MLKGLTMIFADQENPFIIFRSKEMYIYVTQRKLMKLFEGEIKTDILNSTFCSISNKHFDTKTIFISYSYQKL